MRDEKTLYWIWLSERCGAASKEFGRLAEKYDDPFDIYRLEEEEIEHLEGIGNALKGRLCDKSLDSAYSIVRYCQENRVDIITYGSDKYPDRLKRIETPPVLLYCLGRFPDFNNRLCIGMVGTRKMSEYGKTSAYKISYELAAAKAVVVSGMALGVDAVAACGAIEGGGETVAVLGSGLAVVYPREHAKLMKAIVRRGAVISEYPPFERPFPQNFPKRNRIISGLSQGVVVVEGDIGSGALITASKAVSQGREVFAVPGKVSESNSNGPNELIKSGANVSLSADDVIGHYDFLYHDVINYRAFSAAKRKSELHDGALRAYGVSSVYGKVRRESTDKAEAERPEITTAAVAQEPKKEEAPLTDKAARAYEGMDDRTKEIYTLLPEGESFTPDVLAAKGVDIGSIMTALTILEIEGLVTSLPGGMYKKA